MGIDIKNPTGSKDQIICHYRIIERLGGGGMGEVYKAEDIKLKRKVALKFLPPHFSENIDAKNRFIREAQTASSLDHPNICTIFEIDETDDGQMFIALAFYEGDTLKKNISSRVSKQDEAIDVAIQIGKGLSRAHQKGIIHRDIKPANIMITKDGIVKIVDFGLARLAGKSEITKSGDTLGTISYISPEQLQGKKIDHRTDIWSYGVVLYEMLTGGLPFRGEIDQAIIYSILNEAPEPFRITIPQQLQRIILKLLEKNPEDRYQNLKEVINDLQKIEKEGGDIRVEKVKPSIAVLPFSNMSNDENQEYFCDGMAEEIINSLTTVQGLRVIARTSSFSFKGKQVEIREIGRKLNAEMILEGSVRKSDSKLRITAQLINVADGYHIWSEKYDRILEDVFKIQDEISLSIIDELKIKLLEKEKLELTKRYTENLEAYNLYLRGKYFYTRMTKEDISKGINYLEKAIKVDPHYSQAYAALSAAFIVQTGYWFVATNKVSSYAKKAVNKALQLEPDHSDGLGCLGLIKIIFNWDFEGSKNVFQKSIETHHYSTIARSGLAFYYSVTGMLDEAIKIYEDILTYDPLAVNINVHLGVSLLRAKRYQQAREQLLSLLDLVPNHPYTLWILGQTYILESKFSTGIKLYRQALELSNNFPPVLAALGWAYAKQGRNSEAREVINELKKKARLEYVSPFLFGKLYAVLNDKDKAFKWLAKAVEEKDHAILQILTDESVDNIRSDQRFDELLKKMGLYKYNETLKKEKQYNE